MKNLFVMEDGSSDEAENSEEKVAEDDGTGVVSSEPEDRDGQSKCSDKNKL